MPDENDSQQTPRPLAQWVGIGVVATGILLVLASSFGVLVLSDSTLRILLGAGIVLLIGREAAQGVR